jgi:hypothetical protein
VKYFKSAVFTALFLFEEVEIGPIEKGRKVPALFVPNLTINLTYLCYGKTKLLVLWEITKKI